LGYVFDQNAAERQEDWFKTRTGQVSLRLQQELILRLLKPRPRERLLDVGCGSGLHLKMFMGRGLAVTGLDPSPAMLDLARTRLDRRADLIPGRAEDLPFEDNDFDIVTLITCLEFVDDPKAALAEAVRVARSRVFIGVLNRLSLTAMGRRVKGLFKDSLYNQARFFSLWELRGLLRTLAGPAPIHWATVQILPPSLSSRAWPIEEQPVIQQNPFGAFLGLAAEMAYTTRTLTLPVMTSLKLTGKPAPRPSPTALLAGPVSGPCRRTPRSEALGDQ